MFGYKVAIILAATTIIPCVIGSIRFRKLPVSYKLIVTMLIIALFTELLMFILPYFGINNLISMHVYALVEIILLSMFFIHQLKGNSKERRIVRSITIGLSVFAIVYSLFGNNISEFNSIPRAFECMYFSALSCYVFYEMTIDPGPREDDSFYFVNGAILFYFSSSFMVFAFSKFIVSEKEYLLFMYNVHSIVNAMCNIAYAIGLWISSRSSYSVA